MLLELVLLSGMTRGVGRVLLGNQLRGQGGVAQVKGRLAETLALALGAQLDLLAGAGVEQADQLGDRLARQDEARLGGALGADLLDHHAVPVSRDQGQALVLEIEKGAGEVDAMGHGRDRRQHALERGRELGAGELRLEVGLLGGSELGKLLAVAQAEGVLGTADAEADRVLLDLEGDVVLSRAVLDDVAQLGGLDRDRRGLLGLALEFATGRDLELPVRAGQAQLVAVDLQQQAAEDFMQRAVVNDLADPTESLAEGAAGDFKHPFPCS